MCGRINRPNSWPAPGVEGPGAGPLPAARMKRRGETVFTSARPTPASRLDDDGARHVRVKRAEIAELAGFGEGEGKAVAGIQHLRLEQARLRHDGVRDIVGVGP